MAQILNHSPLAAICFDDGDGFHIRVYYQDTDGIIHEIYYDAQIGWNARPQDVVGNARLNTGIAAVSWDSGTQIRVYFLSQENHIVERCYTRGASGPWIDGALTARKVKTAPYSKIAAVNIDSGMKEVRVYYQDTDNKVRELVFDVPDQVWLDGTDVLPVGVPGTSISAVFSTVHSSKRLWVYCQLPDMQFAEWMMNAAGHWSSGSFVYQGTYAPGSCLSAIAWGNIEVCVVGVNDADEMTATIWTDGTWRETVQLPILIPGSAVAAVNITDMADWIRIYCQSTGDQIDERGSNDAGRSWFTRRPILPRRY